MHKLFAIHGSYFPAISGHIINICGYEDGCFLIKDPNTTDDQVAKHTAHQAKPPAKCGNYNIWYFDPNFVHQNIANYYIYTVK